MLRHAFTYKFRTAQNLFVAFVAGTLFAKPTMHTDTAADAIKFSGVLFFALVSAVPFSKRPPNAKKPICHGYAKFSSCFLD